MGLQNTFLSTTLTFLEPKLTLRLISNNLIIIERELHICTSRNLYGGNGFTRLLATWKMYSSFCRSFDNVFGWSDFTSTNSLKVSFTTLEASCGVREIGTCKLFGTFTVTLIWGCHTRRQCHWIQETAAVFKTLVACFIWGLYYPIGIVISHCQDPY